MLNRFLIAKRPCKKRIIYDRIEDKKENVFTIFQSEGDILWLLFNGWSRRFKIIKHCEVE